MTNITLTKPLETQTNVNFNVYTVEEGTTLAKTTAVFALDLSSGNELIVKGTLTSTTGWTVFDTSGTMNAYTITATGVVHSDSNVGLYLDSSDTRLDNAGLIEGITGILASGEGGTFVNSGTILGTVFRGIIATGADFQLVNSGKIQAHAIALELSADGATIVNSGKIIGSATDFYAISAPGTDYVTIENAGLIKGGGGINVSEWGFIDNSGTIKALDGRHAVSLRSGVLDNSGDILGNVVIGYEGRVENSGVIDGYLQIDASASGASGHYQGTGKGRVTEGIYFGYGDDAGYGAKKTDVMYGRGGEDILDGGKGDDTLVGGTEADLIIGGKGDDVLWGADDDGQDTAIDVFVFAGKKPGVDKIMDFENGTDLLDINAYTTNATRIENKLAKAASQKGANVVIDLEKLVGQEGKIKLMDMNIGDLGIDDFLILTA